MRIGFLLNIVAALTLLAVLYALSKRSTVGRSACRFVESSRKGDPSLQSPHVVRGNHGTMGTVPFLLNQLRPPDQGGAALTQAAASIALAQGQPHTIVDVLHGRAFRYYAEGLRQYLAIRTGSTEQRRPLPLASFERSLQRREATS